MSNSATNDGSVISPSTVISCGKRLRWLILGPLTFHHGRQRRLVHSDFCRLLLSTEFLLSVLGHRVRADSGTCHFDDNRPQSPTPPSPCPTTPPLFQSLGTRLRLSPHRVLRRSAALRPSTTHLDAVAVVASARARLRAVARSRGKIRTPRTSTSSRSDLGPLTRMLLLSR